MVDGARLEQNSALPEGVKGNPYDGGGKEGEVPYNPV